MYALKPAGDAEIVHRQAEDEEVGGEQLVDQLLARPQERVLLVRSGLGRRVDRGDHRFGDERDGVVADVPVGDDVAGVGGEPGVDELLRQLPRVRTLAPRAGVQVEQMGHWHSFVSKVGSAIRARGETSAELGEVGVDRPRNRPEEGEFPLAYHRHEPGVRQLPDVWCETVACDTGQSFRSDRQLISPSAAIRSMSANRRGSASALATRANRAASIAGASSPRRISRSISIKSIAV